MKNTIPTRIAALQAELRSAALDAALIYDRENLIYFTGATELEGAVLCVPPEGAPRLFCLWIEAEELREVTGLPVSGYPFPGESQSSMAANWLLEQGKQRPRVGFTRYFISLKDYQCLLAAVPGLVVEDIATTCYRLRSVKCPEELARMRRASAALAAGMAAAVSVVKAGMPETEVLAEAEYAMGKAGSQGSPFRMQVLTHSRQLLLHPYAGATPLEDNAPVVIHLGATVEGYTAKLCRTVFLGKPPQVCVEIYAALRQIQDACVQAIRPGITCGALYEIAARQAATLGYEKEWTMEHIGYGVGIRQSEFYPILAKNSQVQLKENMVVDLLLPTIYRPGVGGPRLTDTIEVTASGGEFLTQYSRDPIFR